jgi:hypothetical protein
MCPNDSDRLFPIRRVTPQGKYCWFGYYDKLQFSPDGRLLLGMEVGFEHRSPRPDDEIALGVIDLADDCRWTEIARTRAWCWQQGCMLQWIPGRESELIYNARSGERFVSRILDVRTGRQRELPEPVYSLSSCGKWAVSADFRRINDCRPGYGYAGLADPHADELRPEDSGIRRIDLATGENRLIVSIDEAAAVDYPHGDLSGKKHYFNHLLVSPDGGRVIFLHRWLTGGEPRWRTRMFTCDAEGGGLHVVDDYGGMSHFDWRDEQHILAYADRPPLGRGFYLFADRSDEVVPVGQEKMAPLGDGHCTYLPDREWIVCDTYPFRDGLQHLYLYHVPTDRRIEIAAIPAPPAYRGEWRCDLHPRHSPDGRTLCIDAAHEGGRAMYLVDIGAALAASCE